MSKSKSVKLVFLTVLLLLVPQSIVSAYYSARSVDDIVTVSESYWYKDCSRADWCWQPVGKYVNVSESSTVTYLEVVYGISVKGGDALFFVEKLKTKIRPGKFARILSGKNNKSFILDYKNEISRSIGPLLGTDSIEYTYQVRYLEYSDGKSIGKKVNN